MPCVSVVIPTYNCARYIEETIACVLAQTGDSVLEIIVVNDGSTDETAQLARAFGGVVRVIDQPNAGVSSARNRGLREARGEFIALMDHDDYWFPDKLAHQLAAFTEHPEVDVVFTDFVRWHANAAGQFVPPARYAAQARAQGSNPALSGWIYHRMLQDSWVLTSTALARARVFAHCGGFDTTLPFSEDWDLWLRVSRHVQFLCLREASTLYRQHANQGSRRIRAVDYRTRLLEQARSQWGLASPDGQQLPARQFRRQLAVYHADFGLGHLSRHPGANRHLAERAFRKAWQTDPRYWRSLAYWAAMRVGWRPSSASD